MHMEFQKNQTTFPFQNELRPIQMGLISGSFLISSENGYILLL